MDLWWDRHDYMKFQHSAHSEIRLYASYEKVNFREAKKKLYQPSISDRLYDEVSEEMKDDDNDIIEPLGSPVLMPRYDSIRILPELVKHSSKISITVDNDDENDDLYKYLSFSVRSSEYIELTNAPISSISKNKLDGGFTFLVGVFSFTLPIIGFYLLHYST